MPRDARSRHGAYSADVMYLGRLARSIERDETVSLDWRKGAIEACNELISKLISPILAKLHADQPELDAWKKRLTAKPAKSTRVLKKRKGK